MNDVYKIRGMSDTEMAVAANGQNFFIIYGECEHGHYIAIPNYGISIWAEESDDIEFNAKRLSECGCGEVADNAWTIAMAISEYFDAEEL